MTFRIFSTSQIVSIEYNITKYARIYPPTNPVIVVDTHFSHGHKIRGERIITAEKKSKIHIQNLHLPPVHQIYDGDDYSLEGDMSVPTAKKNTSQPGQPDFNTLDEPIKETIVSRLTFIPLSGNYFLNQTDYFFHMSLIAA